MTNFWRLIASFIFTCVLIGVFAACVYWLAVGLTVLGVLVFGFLWAATYGLLFN